MNILLVIADLELGGAQQVVINLANEMVKDGETVFLYDVYPELRKEGMIKKLSPNVTLFSKEYNKISFFDKIFNSFLYRTKINKNYLSEKKHKRHLNRLLKFSRTQKIDAVNSHVWWADLLVFEKLKHLHNSWFITFHGCYGYLLRTVCNKEDFCIRARQIIESSQGIIYLSDSQLDSCFPISDKNIKTYKIYNGIPQQKICFLEKENKKNITLLCASRCIKEKGWEELIKAVLKYNQNHSTKIQLTLAGDGPFLQELRQKYSAQEICFLGFKDNIFSLINTSDMVILPSYFESLPTILIESIFCGKYIITTDVGESKFIVTNTQGSCGFLLPKSEGEELEKHIYNALEEVVINKNYLNINKEAFVEAQNIFSISKMKNNYLKVFKGETR
jgi:glycosyltransferase involved in cell wall biosynthesis